LADRTEQQAANLEQTAASVEQLSSILQVNAQTAAQAESAKEIRQPTGASSAQVAASVQSIRTAGGNITQIVSGIRDVAVNMRQIPGIDGQGLVDDIIAQARREPGWVEYEINNPTTGRVQTKMSFVQLVNDLYVGCGVYRNLVVG